MGRLAVTEKERVLGAALGAVIVGLRRKRDRASAEAVARAAGVSVETLRRVEKGLVANPGVFTVAAVARQLDVTVDELTRAAERKASRK